MNEIIDIESLHKKESFISRDLRLKFDNLILNNPNLPGNSYEIVIISQREKFVNQPSGEVMAFDQVDPLIHELTRLDSAGRLEIKDGKPEAPAWEVSLKREKGEDKFLILPFDKAAEILDQPEYAEWKNGTDLQPGIAGKQFYTQLQEHAAFLKRAEHYRCSAYPSGHYLEDAFIRTFTDLTFTDDPTMSLDRKDAYWLEYTDMEDKIESAAKTVLAMDNRLYEEYEDFCECLADYVPIAYAKEVITHTFQKLADKEKNATAESIAADTITNLLEKLKEKGFSAKEISKAIEKSSKKAIKEVNNEKGRA